MAGVARVQIVPEPRADAKEVIAPAALWEQLHITPGRWVAVCAGQKSLRCRVSLSDGRMPDARGASPAVRLHPSVLGRLSIPNGGLAAHIRSDGDGDEQTIRIGPFVAVWGVRGGGPAPFSGHELYFRSLAHYGRSLAIPTYVFSTRDVDWNRGSVRGFQWLRNGRRRGWRRGEFPFPDVVYDRLLSRKAERHPVIRSTRERLLALPGVRYFNPGYFNKWQVHERMAERPELAAYLPATRPLESASTLLEFVRRYPTVFIKPSDGSLGLGITVIQRGPRGYRISHSTRAGVIRRRVAGWEGLAAYVRRHFGRRDYIVQQGIPLARLGGRCFDVRVIMQKDVGGRWHRTKSYVRVAPPGSMTSNLSGGGTAVRLPSAMRAAFGHVRGRRITRQIISLAASLAPIIEEQVGGTIGELGLDLGVDRRGRVWMIEVNSKPYLQMTPGSGTPRDIRLSALRPLRWARYLAGFEPGAKPTPRDDPAPAAAGSAAPVLASDQTER